MELINQRLSETISFIEPQKVERTIKAYFEIKFDEKIKVTKVTQSKEFVSVCYEYESIPQQKTILKEKILFEIIDWKLREHMINHSDERRNKKATELVSIIKSIM